MPLHVVHVEDDRPLRGILNATFRAAEPTINLRQFVSADEAVSYIESNRLTIDLFILDIRLPGVMNGLELAQKIRTINCPGYVVLTSAYSPPSREFLASIRSEYYPKPWHILELTQKLLKYRLDTAKTAPLDRSSSMAAAQAQFNTLPPERRALPLDAYLQSNPTRKNDKGGTA